MPVITTTNSQATKQLGKEIARQIRHGGILCLTGDLGAGKTTFTQGLLKALRVKGPYTSPTFAIVKQYEQQKASPKDTSPGIYHIDAYRINAKDLLNLGWKEMLSQPDNIIIIEWADRISKLIPNQLADRTVWINFKWISEKERKITLSLAKKLSV